LERERLDIEVVITVQGSGRLTVRPSGAGYLVQYRVPEIQAWFKPIFESVMEEISKINEKDQEQLPEFPSYIFDDSGGVETIPPSTEINRMEWMNDRVEVPISPQLDLSFRSQRTRRPVTQRT